MAEQELKKISQEELDEILAQHKLWVKSSRKQGKQADLSYCDLRGLKFPDKAILVRANLEETNLEEANLSGANLSGAYLSKANLSKANLSNTIFICAISYDVNFSKATLMGANLEGAYLENTYFKRANLERANLERANLVNANLEETILIGTDLNRASLEGATVEGADIEWASLEGANLEGVTFKDTNLFNTNLKNTILEKKQSENLAREIIQHKLKVSQLENELKQAKSDNNQSKDQQEKIAELEKQLELMNQYEQELQQLKNISNANEALTHALINTDTQINKNQNNAELCQNWALTLICLDILFVILMPISLNNYIDKFGGWNILFLTFPAVLILFIALSLLRHQKQLIAEIRHYSMLKHKIELYGGILKAAQYIAFAQNSKEDNFIKGIFNEIKTELLKSPNFDLNSQPHIFPEEGGNIAEILKSAMELVKTSTETSKAAAESVKQAISPNK